MYYKIYVIYMCTHVYITCHKYAYIYKLFAANSITFGYFSSFFSVFLFIFYSAVASPYKAKISEGTFIVSSKKETVWQSCSFKRY